MIGQTAIKGPDLRNGGLMSIVNAVPGVLNPTNGKHVVSASVSQGNGSAGSSHELPKTVLFTHYGLGAESPFVLEFYGRSGRVVLHSEVPYCDEWMGVFRSIDQQFSQLGYRRDTTQSDVSTDKPITYWTLH